ncbi:phage baseplate protein [Pseudomonas luteola]|uniref:phage baseplate protein n=1 Tax=Pseudomonas luteola TaxID=47886 RepID=UPI0015E47925|nr:phage baseplate protein [Pseudomonas zeshuii]MBA1250918.1 phage baseplate protein [Pseudomonas zeshuii]
MIGIDRNTGAAVDDWPQFVQRATRALTTPIGTRLKRPGYGSDLPLLLAKNLGDNVLLLAQSYATATFYNAENGVDDFEPETVVARRRDDGGAGLTLRLAGTWKNRKMTFEVTT